MIPLSREPSLLLREVDIDDVRTVLRRRRRIRLPSFRVLAGEQRYSLEMPKSWLARNALTAAALESEARQWEAVGRQFLVRRMS